jgi:hypothetical protein
LNPNRIGWSVVEKASDCQCRCIAWGVFEYPTLNRRLKLPTEDPRAVAQNRKRRHELAILAKKVVLTAVHHRAGRIATERLEIPFKDHGRGRRFNRLLNHCWFKQGFLSPMIRRIEEVGLVHVQVNSAYSSKVGNELWADVLDIPDPACAALELGRRTLHPLPFMPDTRSNPPKLNAGRQRKDGRRVPEKSGALSGWARVWRQLNPTARDIPRRAWRSRHDLLPSGPPRRPSVRELRSHVLHLDPRPGASEPFGFDFSLLLAD